MVNRLLNILKYLDKSKSFFLFGPRGAGKTMLCNKALESVEHHMTISLLNFDTFSRYVTNPSLFRTEVEARVQKQSSLVVYVDEVQKLPQLLDEVHYLLEKYKGKLQFVLTGSSARKLKRGGANLLAGRALTFKLHTLSFLEVSLNLTNNLIKALSIGTLPGIYLDDPTPELSLKSYIETYLQEEILQESIVRQADRFVKFLDVAAQMNAEPVNFSKTAKQCGVSTKTAKEYFSILEDTLIAYKVPGWDRSVKKQLQKAPKFYFFDCGVLNALRRELNLELSPSSYRYGKLFETLVVQELFKLNDYAQADYAIHYYRTSTGAEIDIILSRAGYKEIVAIEIKSTETPEKSDLTTLLSFKEENPKARLYCLCNTPRPFQLAGVPVMNWKEGLQEIFKLS